MKLIGMTMLDRDLEPDYEKEPDPFLRDLAFNDLDDEEILESTYWSATHIYECSVYNEMEKTLTKRDYVF